MSADPTNPATYLSDIPLSTAIAAHNGTSFTPEKRGDQECQSYANTLAHDYASLAKYATTDEKRATLDEEFRTYRAGYRSRYVAMLSAKSRTMSTMITGGSNFPTRRNAKRGATADKRTEDVVGFRERALAAITKALRPELRPVMSGDEDAVERLEAKIAKAEAFQEQAKALNVVIRKHAKAGPDAQVKAIMETFKFSEETARKAIAPDFCGRIGVPAYELQNNNANIRRMKQRLEQISVAKAAPIEQATSVTTAVMFEDNPGENRVRLFFPGKPDANVRTRLKSGGFRWTPSLGCWQAYRNYRTIELAKREAGLDVIDRLCAKEATVEVTVRQGADGKLYVPDAPIDADVKEERFVEWDAHEQEDPDAPEGTEIDYSRTEVTETGYRAPLVQIS